MAVVYVVQKSQRLNRTTGRLEDVFDLSSAEEHGSLQELLSPTAKPFAPEPIVAELYSKLENFSDGDFILCVGNPILIGLATAVAADINEGRVCLLQWNGHKQKYVPVSVDLGW